MLFPFCKQMVIDLTSGHLDEEKYDIKYQQ